MGVTNYLLTGMILQVAPFLALGNLDNTPLPPTYDAPATGFCPQKTNPSVMEQPLKSYVYDI